MGGKKKNTKKKVNMEKTETVDRIYNIKIKEFSGESESLDWFIDQVKDSQRINKLDEETTLFLLKSKLDGAAKKFYSSSPACANITTLEDAIKQLKLFFAPQTTINTEMYALQQLQLQPGETVHNLAHRLDIIINKIYPNAVENDQIKITKRFHLINALPIEIREKILDEDIKEIPEIIQKANLLITNRQNIAFVNQTQVNSSSEIERKILMLNEKIEEVVNLCNFCKEKHELDMCPKFNLILNANQKTNTENVNFNQHESNKTSQSRQKTIICNWCNRNGHSIFNCWYFSPQQFTQPPRFTTPNVYRPRFNQNFNYNTRTFTPSRFRQNFNANSRRPFYNPRNQDTTSRHVNN